MRKSVLHFVALLLRLTAKVDGEPIGVVRKSTCSSSPGCLNSDFATRPRR